VLCPRLVVAPLGSLPWFMSMVCRASPRVNTMAWFWFSGFPFPAWRPRQLDAVDALPEGQQACGGMGTLRKGAPGG